MVTMSLADPPRPVPPPVTQSISTPPPRPRRTAPSTPPRNETSAHGGTRTPVTLPSHWGEWEREDAGTSGCGVGPRRGQGHRPLTRYRVVQR